MTASIFLGYIVVGLFMAGFHRLRLFPGNYWEHLEWLFYGLGMGFIAGSLAMRDGDFLQAGTMGILLGAFMPQIARIIMLPVYGANRRGDSTN